MNTENLTEKSIAVILLREKFANDEILADDEPKFVWSSSPVFMKHNLDRLSTRFNKLKEEYFDESSK